MRSVARWLCGALGAGLIAGCGGSLFKTELPSGQSYQLTPLAAEGTAGAAPLDALLLVPRPIVAPGLDTDRIALVHADRRIDYYAGSQWGAPMPEVIQSAVVESLQNSARFRGVQRDLTNFRPDYVLQLDVRAFQAEYAEGSVPRVRVDLIATVGRLNDRRSVVTFAAAATEPADANTMTAVTAAFDKALQSATRTLLAQVSEYVDRTQGPPAAPQAAPPTPSTPSQ
ncbi:MAG TPA: ABC-type transport auxiliary lipoprotein family protein [Steroidobacteraceae bacterium]|nr:ABC-type transport auxiliary lipoprotein family protein [Steroidobacteraceae bacterium]